MCSQNYFLVPRFIPSTQNDKPSELKKNLSGYTLMIHRAFHSVRAAFYVNISNTDTLTSIYLTFSDHGMIYWDNLFNSKRIYCITGILADDEPTFHEAICFRNYTEKFIQCVYVFGLMYNVFKQIRLYTLVQEGLSKINIEQLSIFRIVNKL
jgi:hypothetical protein